MQLSMDPKFPGYHPDNWELDITVWLNGIQQLRAVAVDTDKGLCIVHTAAHGYVEATGKVEVKNHLGKVLK